MLKPFDRRFSRKALLLALVFLLGGCQVELFGGLSEGEANDIIALLQRNGISVAKTIGKKQVVSLQIDEDRFADAVEILKRAGLPRERFDDLGDVFKKEGMVSSPTEERARFLYARSQELSQTLSQIQGALSARVHVVLPEKKTPTSPSRPASAAVFLRHSMDVNFTGYVPKIKSLVSNAIEGLSYEKVTVALFPVRFQAEDKQEELVDLMGAWIPRNSVSKVKSLMAFFFLFGALSLLLIGGAAHFGYRKFRASRSEGGTDEAMA